MKRATENRGNIRTLSEYFSPKSKVKDLALQERSLPHFTSSLQETPMKPSQVPNQLPHPAQRKMFPLQRPELCNRDRPGPPRHPSHHTGPIYSSRHVPSSPTNTGSSANRPHLTARDRLGSLHHSAQPPGTYCSRLTPVGQTNSGTTANGPQPSPWGVSHPASPQFVKDSSKDSLSKITLSYSGSKNVTGQRHDSNKAQSSNVRSSVQTVQLHRPPVTPSLDTQEAQEDCRPPHSENWSPSNSQWHPRGYQPSPSTQSSDRSSSSTPVTPCQDHQLKRTPSTEKFISAVDLDHSSQKRSRQFEDCGDSAKKVCLRGVNSGNAQMPKPTVGSSLSPSLVSQPSLGDSSVLELSSKTTDSHLCTEPAWDQSASLEITTQSSCTSMGAKQAYISSSDNQTLRLKEFRSSSKPGENDKRSSLLSSDTPQKDTSSSPRFQLGSHNSVYSHRSTSVLPVKTPSRGNQVEESRRLDSKTISASKPISGSLSCRKVERNKTGRQKRPAIIPDDINDLFTPDPMTYVVSHKTAKPKIDGGTIKSSSTFPSKSPSEKSCSSSFVSSSSTTVTASSCVKKQNFTETGSPHAVDTKAQSFSSASQPQVSFPTVALKRINFENLKSSSEDNKLKNSPVTSSGKLLKNESVKLNEKHTSLLSNNVRPRTLETDTAVCKQTSTPHCSQSPLLERQASEGSRKKVNEEDPIDVELDLVQSYIFDLDESQSSHSSESSEEDQLISLKEMMEHVNKPPDTPEKGAFSEPSTPGHRSCQSKTLLPSTTKSYIYKNNLDQMLKEINDNKKTKEIERQLLNACKEDLLKIAEYEEAEENRDGGISTEHQEFLQRYSLMSSAIREVPPGEVVFNLEKFGRIFNQDTLQLRQCMVKPQGTAQKTLLWSSPAQLRLHLNIGLFQEAYDCCSPCPTQVTRFLFKMMSVHNERMVSEKILQALCDIACTAACQIVKNGSQQFNVWVPSLADVALVLMNMGIAFVTLFPFENLQPPFTEGDLLEDINISKTPSSNKEKGTFPEHNCNNILKYLSYCMDLCPRVYSDNELLLLLTVLGRVGLDTQLILQSSVELYPLQYKIVNNIRDWDTMLPRICVALTDLTDDHHNMCLLVQTLPDNTRGKQLRRHLSLSMISKLLDGKCTYRPTEKEIQLAELRLYLPRMQPSTLLRGMLNSSRGTQKAKEDMATLDQQAYYLCYSLLTLANEASKFQFFPAHQKEQLLVLSSELETHVKCDIRESEKCLYRSKVKDLVARIYTKWQMLLQRTRPLNGKLYDYWQPLPVDTSTSSQEEQEIDTSDDGERLVIDESDEEEEENSTTEENDDALITKEKEEGDDTMNERSKIGNDTKPEVTEGDGMMADSTETGDNTRPKDMEGDNTMDDTNEMEEAKELVSGEINSVLPEMEPKGHKESEIINVQAEARNVDCTQVETENLVETKETSEDDQVAVCNVVS